MSDSLGLSAGGDSTEDTGLRRVLGPFDATCIVIGAIVGVGIFFQPTRVASAAGSGELALLAWALGGLIALLGALTFAELGGLYPRTGGQYQILRDSYGPLAGFLFVFCNSTAVQAGATAIIAIICAENLGVAVGFNQLSLGVVLTLSTTMIVLLMLANGLGVVFGSGIQNVTVLAKVLTLLLITALALIVGKESIGGVEASSPGVSRSSFDVVKGVCAALVPTLFAFGGWQHALWIGGEVKNPRRNVPFSIVVGVIVVITVYLLSNWAYLKLLGHSGVARSQTLAADAVSTVWPNIGRRAVAAAVTLSAFGVLNAQLLSGPRLVYAMAKDGRFFRLFARLHPRFATPIPAVLLIGGMAILLLLVARKDGVNALTVGVVFVDGVFFLLTGCAIFVLRRKRPEADRPIRALGYPVIPLLFLAGEASVLLGAFADPSKQHAAWIGAAWILAAFACYWTFFRSRRST